MITCRVIDRTPDRKIYRLKDTEGKVIEIKVEKLREDIKAGKLNVVNVTMGTDGRIRINENKVSKEKNVKKEDYVGETAFKLYGEKVRQMFIFQMIDKRPAEKGERGVFAPIQDINYAAKKIGISVDDFLATIKGLEHNGYVEDLGPSWYIV